MATPRITVEDRKGESDSILASSLAGEIAGSRLKRRQRYRWAGLLSFEKARLNQDADSVPMWRKTTPAHVIDLLFFFGLELTSMVVSISSHMPNFFGLGLGSHYNCGSYY